MYETPRTLDNPLPFLCPFTKQVTHLLVACVYLSYAGHEPGSPGAFTTVEDQCEYLFDNCMVDYNILSNLTHFVVVMIRELGKYYISRVLPRILEQWLKFI